MRSLVCFGLMLVAFGVAHADIIIPGEPLFVPRNPSFGQVRLLLSETRALGIPANAPGQVGESALRPIYQKLQKELEEKTASKDWSLEDACRLGGVLIRLNQHGKAIPVLEKALRGCEEASPWFAPLSLNLAMAYASDDLLLDRAILYQKQGMAALSNPAGSQSVSAWQFQRRVEVVFLKFLQERQLSRNSRNTFSSLKVFGDLENQWPKGDYPKSPVTLSFLDQLSPDALDIALRLVLAFPMDNQVYWLYGEILLLFGEPQSASSVFDELINARQMSSNPVLFDHSRKLKRYLADLPAAKSKAEEKSNAKEEPANAEKSAGPNNLFSGDLRYLLVGFLSGMVALFLIQLQVRQSRKRNH